MRHRMIWYNSKRDQNSGGQSGDMYRELLGQDSTQSEQSRYAADDIQIQRGLQSDEQVQSGEGRLSSEGTGDRRESFDGPSPGWVYGSVVPVGA